MKSIRRSPVFRATCWLLTLALVVPLILIRQKAEAQSQQVLKVIVADIQNRTPSLTPNLGVNATAAVYNELSSQGQGKFFVYDTKTVLAEAQSLGIRIPSVIGQPSNFSQTDLVRIAKSLGADAIVRGVVQSDGSVARGRPVYVGLDVRIYDIASGEEINGGIIEEKSEPRPGQTGDTEELLNKAVQDAALGVVRNIVQKQLVTGTVLNVNSGIVIINRGQRDGIKVGDDITVYREGVNGQKIQQALLRVARVYPDNTEAEITRDIGGVQVEDFARVIYRSPRVLPPPGTNRRLENAPRSTSFSLSAIGATLAVIGLGVVVATAVRGGQTSVSGVTAEAGASNGSPFVRVRFSDNVFGQGGVQQYKIYRLPDFPFGTVGGGGGGGGGNTNATGVPVGTATNAVKEFNDQPSPFFPYANGAGVLLGNSNGGLGTGNNGNNGGNNTTGCGVLVPAATLDTGFRTGTSYRYQVTAVILRQTVQSGGGNNGGGGGIGGGSGGGNGGGSGNNGNAGGSDCIETDPSQSGLATPVLPVILTTPTNQTQSVNISQFTPTFTSRSGADLYQLEISTDRTFRNTSLIYHQIIISTAPNSDGVTQTIPQPIDLTTIPELLRDPVFANFVNSSQGSSPQLPTLYFRVGARHDEDQPGPIHNISLNSSDKDRTFRFVYGNPFSFTPAPVPPPPPGRLAKNSRAAAQLNKQLAGRSVLPLPGDSLNGRGSLQRVLTPQEILTGRGRIRH